MAMLTKSNIMEMVDIKSETVEVPEWGGEVIVRGMSGSERDRYESTLYKQTKEGGVYSNIRAMLVAFCTIDEEGNNLFTPEDIQELGKKSSIPLDKIAEVGRRLSGIGVEEEELKNSGTTPEEFSTLD